MYWAIPFVRDGSKIPGGSGTKDIPGGIRQMYAFSRGLKEKKIYEVFQGVLKNCTMFSQMVLGENTLKRKT